MAMAALIGGICFRDVTRNWGLELIFTMRGVFKDVSQYFKC